ncbi:MAG TPA: hypothetical protein VK172_14900 [Lentimicrobium sp.]|nr:hypothetical protein [Bacteroidales bacterium]HLO92451.1 hypothetical protein [Lentimicrobium sp.]
MKLKEFNKENSMGVTPRAPFIRLNRGAGLITLNSGVKKLMNLKPGDKVSFFQNDENAKDWYIGKSKEGFEAWAKDDNTSLCLNNSLTVNELLNSTGYTDVKGVSFPVSSAEIQEGGGKIILYSYRKAS